ncbi:MAG: hypothetical protein JXJ04_01610 [Spirochaetales bacterium]|nr:hypothetical protein [Spirochaetales bacterium]
MKKKKNWILAALFMILVILAAISSCDPLSMTDIIEKGNAGIFNESKFNTVKFGP